MSLAPTPCPSSPNARTATAGTSRRSARTGRRRLRRLTSICARSRFTADRTKFSAALSPKRFWGCEHMNFDLTEEQQLLRDSVTRLLADRYSFENRKKFQAGPEGWSQDMWRQYAELGLLGVAFPEADGGFGGGPVETMLIMEAFGKALALEPYLATIVLAGGLIRRAGNDEQRATLIPPIASGELRLAFAHAERQSGHDLFDVGASARKDGAV